MANRDFLTLYKIDEKRLKDYFERMKLSYKESEFVEVVANFLINESVAKNYDVVLNVLKYIEDKLVKGKNLLDFAFEWIRANKIFLEYRKYLNSAKYPNHEIAIDDCLFMFFLDYDTVLRTLLKEDVKEFEISFLYATMFNQAEFEEFDLELEIEKHKIINPTIFEGSQRLNTNIFTLKVGLSHIIKEDYEKGRK